MNKPNLGKLKQVPLREVWSKEAEDFTPWLAEEENLNLLGEEIGLVGISNPQTEHNVGKFKADIVAVEDTGDDSEGRKIVIENQLDDTDHSHLGQLITYASGIEAQIVVWIAEKVKDEHKQAVDWLNQSTDANIHFFAIQIELWKVGDSAPAPKFHIVAKPNELTKEIKSAAAGNAISATKLRQREFWEEFNRFAKSKETKLPLQTPAAQHFHRITVCPGVYIGITVNSQKRRLGCELYISRDGDTAFNRLSDEKNAIEQAIGHDLDWRGDLPKGGKKIILLSADDFDINDGSAWEQYHEWLLDKATKFHDAFSRRIVKIRKMEQ